MTFAITESRFTSEALKSILTDSVPFWTYVSFTEIFISGANVSLTLKKDVDVLVFPDVSLAKTVMLYLPIDVRLAGAKTKSID